MLISDGANSDIRYNFFYRAGHMTNTMRCSTSTLQTNHWNYLDLWDLVPGE